MAQIYRDTDNEEHEFPDEATPEQMESAVQGMQKKAGIERFNNAAGIGQPGFAQNFAGGILNGIMSTLKLPDERASKQQTKRPLPKSEVLDPYKLMGTTNQKAGTLAGLEQLGGELFTPGKQATAVAKLMKPGIKERVAETASNLPSKIKEYFSPGKHGEELLSKLGQGAEHSEANSENLAKTLQEKYAQHKAESGEYFEHVKKAVGDKDIYTKPNPLITSEPDKAKAILGKIEGLNVGDLQKAFEAKQSFNNAHKLQSELGDWIGQFKKKPFKSQEELAQLDKVVGIRNQLKTDLMDFLKRHDATSNSGLAKPYETGIKIHREGAAHYTADPVIGDIVKGGEQNIKNIHEPFEYLTSKDKGIAKIVSELPEEAKGQILFSKIGGLENIKNPKALYKSLVNAKQNGYSKYFTPELEESIKALQGKIKHQKVLKQAAKWGGATIGSGLTAYELLKK